MRNKYILVGIVVGVLLASVAVVLAGQIDSPAAPTATGGQMYTLEQIYDRLVAGTAATKMTTFTEPSSGPGATARTLDEIMAVAKPPGALAPRVNKTGQTECYKSALPWGTCTCGDTDCPSGQDGEYEMGIDPVIAPSSGTTGGYNTPAWTGVRFTDNGDGTVTDNLTALIWLKDASCSDFGHPNLVTAYSAVNALANGTCGLSDGSSAGNWRLPNVNELHSLIDLTQSNPALPSGHPFDGILGAGYWSSTTDNSWIPAVAWYVNLSTGSVVSASKSNTYYVWPVRGGQ